MGQAIEWGGDRWYRNRSGYYQNRRGKLMHRAVWESVHGPVSRRIDIHHSDEDPGNNSIENLVALSRAEHLATHGPRGFLKWSPAQRAESMRGQWTRRPATERKCERCGNAFASTATVAKWCSPKCYNAARYALHPKPRKGRDHLRRAARPCASCGTEFKARDPRTVTCSRPCGVAYKCSRREHHAAS